jgi:predicted DNA repair protein MutK
MPVTMEALTVIGTAAMLWVGGGIIVHGLEHFHLTPVPHWVEAASHWAASPFRRRPVTGWLAMAAGSAVVGLIVGGVIVGVVHLIPMSTSLLGMSFLSRLESFEFGRGKLTLKWRDRAD